MLTTLCLLLPLLLQGTELLPTQGEPVSLTSLLREQRDRDALARYPEPVYRQLQSSSYNRASKARDQKEQGTAGWFADSDGVSCLRKETKSGRSEWVLVDHKGPGCLTKFWTPYFYYSLANRVGPNVRIYLDGAEKPVIEAKFIELLTRNEWPEPYGKRPPKQNSLEIPRPFADFTARAGDLYLPIPFAKSCKVTLSAKPFYHIVNLRSYPEGTRVQTFTMQEYHDAKAELNATAKALLSPRDFDAGKRSTKKLRLLPGKSCERTLEAGPAAIRHFELRLDSGYVAKHPQVLRSTVLKITFDGEESVWCPIGDYFCSANRIHPMQTWTRSVRRDGKFSCRWVMPYRDSAVLQILNLGDRAVPLEYVVQTGKWQWDKRSMHFFARWRSDHVQPGNEFLDWNFVDIHGKGVFIGDAWTVLNLTNGWWGEGDEKIYLDDSYDKRKFPDHFGTGTEDYYGWAGGVNPTRKDVFSVPFLANVSVGSTSSSTTRGFNICTRIRSLDAIPFKSRLVFDMEASPGVNQRNAWNLLGYSAVSFFYALPGATHNRPANPKAAAGPLMSLDKVTRQSAQRKRKIVR